MFQFLRKLIVPIIVTVLVFFVAMIILQWGYEFTSSNRARGVDAAAVINGESVSWQVYNNLYNNLYQQASRKDSGTVTEAEEKDLQERAWGQLVHEKLLAQQAEKNGIEVTDEEVYQYLRSNPPPELQQVPQFQTNGQFDYQKYFTAMTSPELNSFWASVEPIVRTDLKKLKMQELVIQAAQVSESEVKEQFLMNTEKVKVGAIFITFDRFTRPPPTIGDEEAKAYFDAHQENYTLTERAALNVALIEKTPSERDWNVAYKKLKAIRDSIAAGASFTDMAAKYSEDVSKNNGGDLGWFARGAMVPEFDRFSFSMKDGELSEPFKTQFGWHIILHHGYKEEKETPPGKTSPELVKRAHVSHILIKVTPSSETLDEAHQRLTSFIADAKQNGFEAAAKSMKLTFHKTEYFPRGGNIQYLGKDANAGLFAFDNPANTISAVMENNSSVYVVQALGTLPAGPASFADAKEKVQVDALRAHIATMCHDTMQAIYSAIQSGMPIEKAAELHGAKYEELEPFTRTTLQRPISNDPVALGTAFGLSQVGEVSKPADFKQGSVIYKLLDRSAPDLTEYSTKRDSIYHVILSGKQQQLYSKWYENLMNESKIENNVQKSLSQEQQASL